MRNLKYYRYLGKFYEYEGKLGWMPFYKVFMTFAWGHYSTIKWVPQSMVRFD